MYVEVAEEDALEDGECRSIRVDGLELVLCRVDATYYALDNTCTHAGGSLGDGGLHDMVLMCPLHGAEFDVRSGEPIDKTVNPATEGVDSYDVKVRDGQVMVQLR